MTQDVNIDNLCSFEIDWKYLEASQQLQLDKQNHGACQTQCKIHQANWRIKLYDINDLLE